MTYADVHARSIADPETFWSDQAALIDWIAAPTRALDDDRAPFTRWYPDGELNVCHNAVDRHVEAGHGDRTAIVYDSPVSGAKAEISYAELRDRVARTAGALASLGVERGDRVLVYMPMIPEAVVAMLACARLGAVHSVVFGGFAAKEVAVRIDDAKPRVILAASAGIEPKRVVEYKPILDAALEIAEHRPDHLVVKQREVCAAVLRGDAEHDWDELVAAAAPAPCAPVAATDPLYILYTSGTTGTPKGVVRDSGGYAVALAWSMRNIYDIGPGRVMFTASDVGWVVGHSYIVYGPLIAGATSVLYEGKPVGTPDASAFWRVVSEHRVNALFTAPTAMRAVKKVDPLAKLAEPFDLASLETVFLAGERLDPDTYHWVSEHLGVPVIDNYWQTETGWPIAANQRGLEPMPVKPGSPTVPSPGYDVRILDEHGAELPAGEEGALCIALPLPPGTLQTVYGDDERFVKSYLASHPGYYVSGDGGYLDEDGYLFVMGRTDDIINVAGHRLSTGAMEAVLADHWAVAECAVIGVDDALKGEHPLGLVVLTQGATVSEADLHRELVQMVREWIGPVADFKSVITVPALPKTRSGKILRKTMRQIANGQDPQIPSTIDDPAALDALRPLLAPDPEGLGTGLVTIGF